MNQHSTLHHQRVRKQFTKRNTEIFYFKLNFSLGENCIFVVRTPLLSLIYKKNIYLCQIRCCCIAKGAIKEYHVVMLR